MQIDKVPISSWNGIIACTGRRSGVDKRDLTLREHDRHGTCTRSGTCVGVTAEHQLIDFCKVTHLHDT